MTDTPNKILIALSYFVVFIIWGTTYLANIIAIDELPPFYLVWARLLLAGVITLGINLIFGKFVMPTRLQWKNLFISSVLFLAIGLTGAVWAEQYIDSGITALMVSFEPLMVVLLMWLVSRKMPFWNKFLGCIIGMIGMYLLVSQEEIVTDQNDIKGIIAIMISIVSWAVGSIFISKADLPKSMLTTASFQMLISGIIIFAISISMGDLQKVDVMALEQKTYIAYFYVVIFGSILAYTSFNYLLKYVSPEKVATSTYIHPLVAVVLGWAIRDEVISVQTIFAMGVMLTGVFFINSDGARKLFRKKKT